MFQACIKYSQFVLSPAIAFTYLPSHFRDKYLIKIWISSSVNFRDYDFSVTEVDLEYAENFDAEKLGLDEWINISVNKQDFGKYEPTHIIYNYDINGNLNYKWLEYRYRDKKFNKLREHSFKVFPEDELGVAGEKFKIGDIVRIRKDVDKDDLLMPGFTENDPPDKLYIVRWLPRRKEGQKYFDNTYAIISTYDNEYTGRGLFTFEAYESHLEKYEGEIPKDSFIPILQRIIKGDIEVSKETWQLLKNGQISFDTRKRFNELEELKKKDEENKQN